MFNSIISLFYIAYRIVLHILYLRRINAKVKIIVFLFSLTSFNVKKFTYIKIIFVSEKLFAIINMQL